MYDFTAIDFETANNSMNSACSVGLVAVKDFEIVKTDYFLIKPPTQHFRHENTEIHGITYDSVKDCDPFPCVYPVIKEYICNSVFLVAHNAQFDMSVLHECLATYNIDMPEFLYIDTANLSAPVRENCGNSLSDCAAYFSIKNKQHHNALSDAITCAKIVMASVSASRYKTFFTYINCYSRIKKRSFAELKPNKEMIPKSHQQFSRVKISELSTTVTEFNQAHPFYGKNCVFTGELQKIERKSAMQKVLDLGGIVKSSVSSKTDYLIVGVQDKKIVGEDGLSTKEEKAYSLLEKGAKIKIINENQFLEFLENPDINKGELFMDMQLSFAQMIEASFWENLNSLLKKIMFERELPPSSLHIYSNISTKTNKEISKSICIYEPDYPSAKTDIDNPGKNLVVMNIQTRNGIEFLIRKKQFASLPVPDNAIAKEFPSDSAFVHVFFANVDTFVFDYIEQNIFYCLSTYRSRAKSFGCCSKHIECSDAKRCIHENKLYSTACLYRKNLEAGKIFYGINKNI